MNLSQDMVKLIKRKMIGLSWSLGIDIQKVQDLDVQIRKLRFITNPETRLRAVEELVHQYPEHPKPHLELAQCMHILSDPRQFEQMDRYAEVRQGWLVQTGLDEIDMEFIWPGIVIGSLGNHYCIETLLRANQTGLRSAKKPFLLLSEKAQLRNPALFSYFEHHLWVIRDEESIQSLRRLEALLTLPLGLGLPMTKGCPFLDIVANRVEMERKKQGLEPFFFQLSDQHREMGEETLKKLGMPGDAWYVTLHVREPGYRGETLENTKHHWRNANPMDYLKACKAVTQAGGWVFRMGDPSMTPLEPMPHVIDYAHNEIRSDWMDVFLGSTCRFSIGTGSGYYIIPMFFGVPFILTNFPGFVPYYGMRSHDLYLPRWLKKLQTGKLVSFEEFMSHPTSMFSSVKSFQDAGLQWIENTPDELEATTNEMLQRTNSTLSSTIPDEDLQQRFKAMAETCGMKYDGRPVKAFASISRDFLARHADLLEG